MYYFNAMCCICLAEKAGLKQMLESENEEWDYFMKLTLCIPEMLCREMYKNKLLCEECCHTIDIVYKFRQKCLQSKLMLTDYISQFHSDSNVSGTVSECLTTDICDIKIEDHPMEIESESDSFGITCVTKDRNKMTDFGVHLASINKYIKTERDIVRLGTKSNKCDENPDLTFIKDIESDRVSVPATSMDINIKDIKIEHDILDAEPENDNYIKNPCVPTNYNENGTLNVHVASSDINNKIKQECDSFDMEPETLNNTNYKSSFINVTTDVNDVHLPEEDNLDIKYEEANAEVETYFNLENPNSSDPLQEPFTPGISLPVHEELNTVAADRTKEYKHECQICKKKFKIKSRLERHQLIHSNDKPYACDNCDKSFAQKCNLQLHMKVHTEQKPYECNVCNRIFIRERSLIVHMRVHTGEKLHECNTCNKKFTDKSGLSNHILTHTGEKPFKCNICDNRFILKKNLKLHMMIHTGEKPFQCNICNKKFPQKHTLSKHMAVHDVVKPHVCSTCNKSFSQKYDLTVHMISHTGEKPHECTVCNKKFISKSHLSTHMVVHDEIKPHACIICHKRFTQKYHLTVHMESHSKEKSHECNVCNKTYSSKYTLSTHMLTHVEKKQI